MRDPLYLVPGSGETLEFSVGATISGVLDEDEIYRLACDADCWIEIDDGGGGMLAAGSTAVLMTNDSIEYFRTTAQHKVLHVLGVTTSGLCNYIRMDDQ